MICEAYTLNTCPVRHPSPPVHLPAFFNSLPPAPPPRILPPAHHAQMSARFMRHFTLLCLPPPSEVAMRTIFSAILGGFLDDYFAPGGAGAHTHMHTHTQTQLVLSTWA